MSRSLAVYKALYKSLPTGSRPHFRQLWLQHPTLAFSDSEAKAVLECLRTMRIHDDYLKFFNIAQKKDELAKIERVSRYVGLGLPKLRKD